MIILENNLSVEIETWDDPGDYPSAAGSGPLPSTSEAVLDGDVVIEITPTELVEMLGDLLDEIELPRHVSSVSSWTIKVVQQPHDNLRLIVTPVEADFTD